MKKILLIIFILSSFLSHAQQVPFITTWEVTAGDLSISIPTNTADYIYDYTIDFGDGTVLTNQTGDVTHIYASPGAYSVSISGVFPHFYTGSNGNFTGLNEKLKSIDQWGNNQWLSMKSAFANYVDMVINATDIPDLSQVSDMSIMFYNCKAFNQNINNWDVSNVTDMSMIFKDADSFNQPLNNWDVSNVTDMDSVFHRTLLFNQPLNNWIVSNVADMSFMFAGANVFNQPLDNWDVSNVTDMSYMFSEAISFNQNINNWDVSNVTNMSWMFGIAHSFIQPLDNWSVSNVTDMSYMFAHAIAFNQPINNWDVSNVANMMGMFKGAAQFNQPLNDWNMSNVSFIGEMFHDATSFDQPLNSWDVSNISGFNISFYGWGVFHNASSFNQDLSSWNFTANDLDDFLDNSGMDITNYELLIDKLLQLNISNGVLGAENIEYCDSFTRQQLINAGWTINDDSQSASCNLNYVSGNVLYDASSDGCDSSDFDLSNYLLNVNNGTDDAAFDMDDNGNYVIGLDSGNFTLSILNLGSNFTSTPDFQTVNFSGQDEILENIDFCITANHQFEDLAIDIFSLEDAIPGFETDYQVIVTNNGTQTVPNVQVSFGYDESFQTYVSSTVPTSGTSTDILDFELTNLEPFSQEVFEVTLINEVPPTLNSGDVLSFTTSVTPDANDTTPVDNTTVFNQTVVNSFDPNDKMVVQGDQIVDEDIDQYLDYRIRFQNLGTANALNVKITDTIDNNLDWTTFQPITSSHDYRIEIVDGEQINYYFDNINLPFEAADEEGSNGYITYKIKPKTTVQIGDVIKNTAYIYFDFNLPIITNTAVTTVVDNLDVERFDFSSIKVYPNPVKEILNLDNPTSIQINSLLLYDIQGKLIKVFEIQNQLSLSGIDKGLYILKLETDRGTFHKKVIKR